MQFGVCRYGAQCRFNHPMRGFAASHEDMLAQPASHPPGHMVPQLARGQQQPELGTPYPTDQLQAALKVRHAVVVGDQTVPAQFSVTYSE